MRVKSIKNIAAHPGFTRRLSRSLVALAMTLSMTGCGWFSNGEQSTGKQGPIIVPAGTQVPGLSVGFDLSYDSSTDDIIPGYRILTVGISNNSLKVLQLHLMADQWSVVDRKGKTHRAVLNLRNSNPDVWSKLPKRLKTLIEYPLMIDLAQSRAVDLLFPDKVVLNEFREVVFGSAGLDKIIRIYPREKNN